jgi:hypothetical protein
VKFWQAVVVSQMAAGAVWADGFTGILWAHLLADAGNIVFGVIMWSALKCCFNPTPKGSA